MACVRACGSLLAAGMRAYLWPKAHLKHRAVPIEVGLHAEEERLKVQTLDVGSGERRAVGCGDRAEDLLDVHLERARDVAEA